MQPILPAPLTKRRGTEINPGILAEGGFAPVLPHLREA